MDLPELVGQWRLQRRLVDRRTSTFGRVEGRLTIEAGSARLRWVEAGQLTWAEQCLTVSREYGLEFIDGQWWMTFADGRLFHPWTPGQVVRHDCVDDLYVGLVQVSAARMRTVWDVTGPAKHQRIVTRFERLA